MLIEIKAGQFRKVSRLGQAGVLQLYGRQLSVARRRRNAYLCAVDFQIPHLLQPFQGRCASSRQGTVSGANLRQRLQALSKLQLTLLFQGSQ